jgi:WD40 repeat protein
VTSPTPSPSSPRNGGALVGPGPPDIPDHTLLRLIGRGSYGEVWLARNVMGTYRAVKVVYRATFDDKRPYEREFAGIRKFEPISRSHESQVQILHIGRNDEQGYFYYVMELADDAAERSNGVMECRSDGNPQMAQVPNTSTLQHSNTPALLHATPPALHDPAAYVPRTLQHEIETGGRLPFAECLRISLALAGALKHLHGHGLVHRDIKPSNIIFINGIPKLADIGLVTESEATITYVGAQGFMAPEGPGRPRGDLYSLGKVIYEICTGRDRMDFPALPAGFGDWQDREQVNELLALSLKACEPDPAKRQASAEALLADLVMVQAGKSVRRLRKLERGQRWALAAVAVGTLVGLLAVTGVWLFGRVRQREVLIREAETLRLHEPSYSWSSSALEKLRVAARIHLDDDVRAQAAAVFGGLDTQVVRDLTNSGTDHLVFDRAGRFLLMDGGLKGQRARLWDTASGEVKEFAVSGRGPVWFGHDSRPRLLHAVQPGVYQVTSLEDGRPLSRFEFSAGPYDSGVNRMAPIAVSPDGSLAVAAIESVTNTEEGLEARVSHLAVWRTETGEVMWQGVEPCVTLAFAPNGNCLAIGKSDGGVQVRSLPEWRLVAAFTNDNAAVDSLAFGRDPGQPSHPAAIYPWLLAAGTSGGTVWIYRLSPPGVQAICRGGHYNVFAVAFAPDEMTLVSGGRGEPLAWDVATGRLLLRTDEADFATALAFSPDGRRLAIGTQPGFGSAPGQVRLLAVQPDRGIRSLRGLSSQSDKVAFSHDGQRLAALARNWEVGIWNLASNRLERLLRVPQGISADNAALAFSRDDNLFAFATSERATLRDARTGIELKSWRLPRGLGEHLWFDSAGRLFLFQWDWPPTGPPGEYIMRDLSQDNYLKPLHRFRFFDGRPFQSCLSSDGQVLAVCGSRFRGSYTNHLLKVINPQTGQVLCSLPAPNTGDWDAFSLDASGRLLGYNKEAGKGMDFFEIPSGRLTGHFDGKIGELSPGAAWLAYRLDPGDSLVGVRVWQRESPQRSVVLGAGLWGPADPEFSPDGRFIAWGTTDGTVMVAEMAQVFQRMEQLGLGWR